MFSFKSGWLGFSDGFSPQVGHTYTPTHTEAHYTCLYTHSLSRYMLTVHNVLPVYLNAELSLSLTFILFILMFIQQFQLDRKQAFTFTVVSAVIITVSLKLMMFSNSFLSLSLL